MTTEVLRHHHTGHPGSQQQQLLDQQHSPKSPHPPSLYHSHSSANDSNNTEETNAGGNGGPTMADFAADGNNDLDEPRMVQNRDGTVEDWNHITKPGCNDVLLGRGGGTNNHTGNVKFRQLVNEHKMAYLACSKVCNIFPTSSLLGLGVSFANLSSIGGQTKGRSRSCSHLAQNGACWSLFSS
jgi:hypothetical protein